MTEIAYQGYEVEQPEGFMEPKVYRVRWECPNCGHKWSKTFKSVPLEDPPCPSVKCTVSRETAALAQQVANLTRMLQEQRGPATIGDKLAVKAIDATAQIVMEDNQLTDLKDNIRRGESMAPKLPPAAQIAADNFFKKGAQAGARVIGTNKTLNARQTNHMKTLGQRAIHGAFRNASVPPNVVLPRTRPVGQPTSNPGYVRR